MFGVPSTVLIEATLRSIAVSGTCALIAGFAGILVAWLTTRTELPGSRVLSSLVSVPYALPPYLLGMAWVVLGNPTVGLLKDFLPQTGSYGFWGMTLVLSSVAFAYPYMELRAGFERLDPALEEAARMSGASPWKVFTDISLPLLWPSLVNGMCLAFLFALSAFGVPALLGLPVRQFVLTTLIYSQIKLGGLHGMEAGFGLSLILLLIAGVVLGSSLWLNQIKLKKSGGAIAGAKSSRPSLVDIGIWTYPAVLGCWAFLLVTVALPWFALGISALAPVAGKYSPSLWTLRNIQTVLGLSEFQEGLIHSLVLSAVVASIIVIGGFLLAFLAVRKNKRWALWIIESFGIPFATPGTVIAIAVVFVSTWVGRLGLELDSPLVWIALAYALKHAAIGARSMLTAFRQVHPALEEAGRVSGASTLELLKDLWFPILKKTIFSTWLLALLPMLTELTMSVLLTGPGASTLGTILFELQEYRDQPSAAALAWLLLTVALLVSFFTRARKTET